MLIKTTTLAAAALLLTASYAQTCDDTAYATAEDAYTAASTERTGCLSDADPYDASAQYTCNLDYENACIALGDDYQVCTRAADGFFTYFPSAECYPKIVGCEANIDEGDDCSIKYSEAHTPPPPETCDHAAFVNATETDAFIAMITNFTDCKFEAVFGEGTRDQAECNRLYEEECIALGEGYQSCFWPGLYNGFKLFSEEPYCLPSLEGCDERYKEGTDCTVTYSEANAPTTAAESGVSGLEVAMALGAAAFGLLAFF